MSTILGDDLITTLTSELTPVRQINCTDIYLNLTKDLLPAGSLALQVQDSTGNLMAASNAVTIASIDTAFASADYVRAFVRFDINFSFQIGVIYNLVLTASGYTATSSDFIAWLRDWDNQSGALRRVPITYNETTSEDAPFDYIMFEDKTVRKGVF